MRVALQFILLMKKESVISALEASSSLLLGR